MSVVLKLPSAESLVQYSLEGVEGDPAFSRELRNDRNRMSGHSKLRTIMVPNTAMRRLQSNLREYVRTLPVDYRYATAYRPGCSVKKNVERHRYNRYFYLLDLESAFDQVEGRVLATVVATLIADMAARARSAIGGSPDFAAPPPQEDQEEQLLAFFTQYCLLSGGRGLPQGGPASQDLFNIYCAVLFDRDLGRYCKRHNLTYTRYGDDLTFSSPEPFGTVVRRKIRQIVSAAGFGISHHKCEVVDIARIGGRSVLINGIRLMYGGRMQAPANFVSSARSITRAAKMSGDEHLYHKALGLAGAVLYVARGRKLSRTEKKLAHDIAELKALWRE